jgi:hypothetical protein
MSLKIYLWYGFYVIAERQERRCTKTLKEKYEWD